MRGDGWRLYVLRCNAILATDGQSCLIRVELVLILERWEEDTIVVD